MFYEQFCAGDLTTALEASDTLGVPRRRGDAAISHRPVEKMSDETNQDWRARFIREMDAKTCGIVEQYNIDVQS